MEWETWRQQPETQALLKHLNRKRDDLKEDWASGQFLGDSHTTETGNNAEAIGRCNQLGEIIYTIVDEPDSMEELDE
jgi:hypothetical protein